MKKSTNTFQNSDVAEVFANYPDKIRERLLYLRELIFDVAKETEGVGRIEEVLKWGQPSYVTEESKSGSTFRIDKIKTEEDQYAIFFHCQTDLISRFRKNFPKQFSFEGNRAIIFTEGNKIPEKELKECIASALTYHSDKKKSQGSKKTSKKKSDKKYRN
ncbi:DUF1801 domain-containing protein [Leptospira semungkisensis]|uniref:DUF1801 domain-containing protein n=1 Tax=Leptospira semungkisensis TaxID=2484985 RepID=A0A4V3JBY6_9LEPT|nr:DUF1801 domain-containing protein [Leptospira semungkisensis]TGK03999.1 DUF1801 domain-containing protein [Leptospira semungkisensis]